MHKGVAGASALAFGVMFGLAGEGLAAPVPVLKSEQANLIETVGYKKRRTYVRAPFTEVESGRHTWVAAPFARVYSGRRGTWVRAPFVDLWVPR
jgi:hypothetical protein